MFEFVCTCIYMYMFELACIYMYIWVFFNKHDKNKSFFASNSSKIDYWIFQLSLQHVQWTWWIYYTLYIYILNTSKCSKETLSLSNFSIKHYLWKSMQFTKYFELMDFSNIKMTTWNCRKKVFHQKETHKLKKKQANLKGKFKQFKL